VNVQLADGGVDFRVAHHRKWGEAWTQWRCQTCGERLLRPTVLFGGPEQVARLLFDEPPLHPECALYASRACPMVAGRQERYRGSEPVSAGARGARCYVEGCDCGGWVPHPGPSSGATPNDPAHPWYAVYVSTYRLAYDEDGFLRGGACDREHVLRVRLVSAPGRGRVWEGVPHPTELIGAVIAAEERPGTRRWYESEEADDGATP
jgi:hypothetical protein